MSAAQALLREGAAQLLWGERLLHTAEGAEGAAAHLSELTSSSAMFWVSAAAPRLSLAPRAACGQPRANAPTPPPSVPLRIRPRCGEPWRSQAPA